MQRLMGFFVVLGFILSVWLLPAPLQAAEQTDIPIEEAYFPDVRFRWYLLESVDKNQNGILEEEERMAITRLGSDFWAHDTVWDDVWKWLAYMDHEKGKLEPDATLKGLEYFPNLEEFYWYMPINLPELDLSGNPKLKVLELSYAYVLSKGPHRLDLSANHALESLKLDLNLDEDELILPADAVWKEKEISKDGTASVNGNAKIPVQEPPREIKPGGMSGDGKGDIRITKANFPGEKFRRYLYVRIDSNWDGILSEAERMAVSCIVGRETGDGLCWDSMWNSFQKRKVDFTGIGYFPNIEQLSLWNLTIRNLDFRQLKRLKVLHSYSSKYPELTTLDLTENAELEELLIEYPSDYSGISTLDVKNNKKLKELFLVDTKMDSLDLTENTELEQLYLSETNISALDVKNNKKLKKIALYRETKVKSLDLTENTELEEIVFSYLKIPALNVRNNKNLKTLQLIGEAKIKSLDLRENAELRRLTISGSKISTLNVKKNKKLKKLNLLGKGTEKIRTLNLSKNTELEELYISNLKISTLKVRNNKKLKELTLKKTKVKSLDLRKNRNLEWLWCSKNQLKKVYFPKKSSKLKHVECDANRLEKLDLSKCSNLDYLNCQKNKLTKLILPRKVKELSCLDCSKNRLKKIRVKQIKIYKLLKDNTTKKV